LAIAECRLAIDGLAIGDWPLGLLIGDYRATCRARSPEEFIAKVGVAAEEADESKGWLELLVKAGKTSIEVAGALIKEADELTAIFVASRITVQRNRAERQQFQKQMRLSRRKPK
jgi:hypothetical protein